MRRLLPDFAAEVDPSEEYAYPRQRRGGSWLRANFVSSVDGAAAFEGRSRGLSNPPDKRLFQLLRGLADVVIAGAGTVRVEGYEAVEPREQFAEARRAAGQHPAPVLCVVSGSLDLDFSSPLFPATEPRTIVVTSSLADPARLARARAVADVVETGPGGLDLTVLVGALGERGYHRLLCEGGPTLMHHLTARGLLDELCLTVSPLLTGGAAPRVLDGPTLASPVPLRLAALLEEDDVLFTRYVIARQGR